MYYRKSTPEEKILRQALEKLGVRVLSQVDDGYKRIDLAIPSARINIEVDGIHHLTNPYQMLKDLQRAHYSDELGYSTIHIHNSEIYSNLDDIANALADASRIREEQLEKNIKI